MRNVILSLLVVPALLAITGRGQAAETEVSISGNRWLINGQLTYPGAPAEGLLMNVRMVNTVYEDIGPAAHNLPPGFTPEANTQAFIARIPEYAAHGVRAFTVSLQGGMPGYEGAINSAFTTSGALRSSYMDRVSSVIEACDQHGVVVILSCLYQRQRHSLNGKQAIRNAVANAAQWIGQARPGRPDGYTNVVLEIANEYDHSGYSNWQDGSWLRSTAGQVELIQLAQQTLPHLLVSTSPGGHGRVPSAIAEAADFVLIHFNNTSISNYPSRIADAAAYGKPVVVNEDDKIGSAGVDAASACVTHGASWGFMHKHKNQFVPFEYDGAADDPAVYGYLLTVSGGPPDQPPGAPSNPHPADMSSNVRVDTILSWTAGTWATAHEVYFGTTNPPPYHGTSTTGTSYDPGPLDLLETYYWQVEAVNDHGSTFGDLWQFATSADDDPTPSDPTAHNWHAEFTSLAGSGPGHFTSPYASSTGASGGDFYVMYQQDLPSNWLSLVDGNILRFNTGSASSRGRFGATHTIDPTIGAAVAYRLRMDQTTIGRGPFQLCVFDGATPYNCYVRYNNSTITILNNSGGAYSGIDPYSKPMTGFHDWCLAVRVGGGYAHWNLWIDGERIAFSGEDGNHVYDGVPYSFRTSANSFTPRDDKAYIGLGELHRQSGWEFRYDWVRWTDQGDVYFGDPYFHSHPADEEKVAGETATFSVATWSGGTVDYQWQVKAPGGGWNNLSGETGPSYTTEILMEADDGNQYRCRARRDDRPYVYSHPATLTVTPVPCEDPVLLAAYSVMTHGAEGDFAVGIALDEPYAIEPRAGADHRLEFVFDQPIDIGDASVILSSGAIAGLDRTTTHVTNDTLVATLEAAPTNNACLMIEVGGVTDFTVRCAMAPAVLYLRMIQGKLDDNSQVNLNDLSIVRADLYQAVTVVNFMSDVNADGVINLTDLSLVRDNLYQQAACP